MENSMSRIVVEAVVKRALKGIKDCPERGIRNLIDLALEFSRGRFQQTFFTVAQQMLQNENSAYYGLMRDVVSCTDMERLYTFGMDLGYNGCTIGARRIRENEAKLKCNIPWAVTAQLGSARFAENRQTYQTLIKDGEALGIYVWMLFAQPEPRTVLTLAREHPDSAFCVFCEDGDLSDPFLEEAAGLFNLMLVVRYEEGAADLCATLREMGLFYSVWYPYGQKDAETILNGELFHATQQFSPAFTVLVPDRGCPEEVRRLVEQAVVRARDDQTYRTIPWELLGDNRMIDSVISGDACSACFDQEGELRGWDRKFASACHNLFQSSLSEILASACPKERGLPA